MRPTIVLIPGLMCDGWVWSALIPALSRVGALHIACNDGADTLAAMADRILQATSGPLALIGHSMGGRVALEVIAAAPDRVAALALLSTGVHGPRPSETSTRMHLVELANAQGMAAVAAAWLPDMIAADAPAELRDGTARMLQRASPATFAPQQRALLTRADRTELLATITCPTLVATGEHDGWAPPAQHAAIAERIPGAQLEVIPRAGHMLPLEAPAPLEEALLRLLR